MCNDVHADNECRSQPRGRVSMEMLDEGNRLTVIVDEVALVGGAAVRELAALHSRKTAQVGMEVCSVQTSNIRQHSSRSTTQTAQADIFVRWRAWPKRACMHQAAPWWMEGTPNGICIVSLMCSMPCMRRWRVDSHQKRPMAQAVTGRPVRCRHRDALQQAEQKQPLSTYQQIRETAKCAMRQRVCV